MTRDEIAAVVASIPQLTTFGVGIYGRGRGLSPAERAMKLKAEQDQLLDSAEPCTKICDWLATKEKIKTCRRSSYSLKHMAERDIGEYITNGQFIVAALHCGFPYKLEWDSSNVRFGVAQKSLKVAHR